MATFTFATGTVRTESFYDNTAGKNKLTVAADAFINVEDNWTAIGIQGGGVWDVKVDGGLWATHAPSQPSDGNGIEFHNFLSTINSKLTVGAEGTIAGERQGVQSNVALNVVNSGNIAGGRHALNFDGFQGPDEIRDGSESNLNQAGKQIKIDNKAGGVIESYFLGINNDSYATITVNNSGDIYGGKNVSWGDGDWQGAAIHSGVGVLKLTNKGYIEGDVGTGWFGNVITNQGEIDGTVWGYIERNDDDIVDLDRDGDYADFATGGAVHEDNITGLATTIVNKGEIYGNQDYGRNDNDTPEDLTDDEFFQVALDLGRGKDIVTNSGQIYGEVWLGGGDDTLTNDKKGYIKGYVDGWRGNDTIINKGTIEYGVGGGDGNDVLDNSGNINGNVNMGGGNNTIINKGFIAENVRGGDQVDTVTNSGTMNEGVELNGGADKLTNTGTINGFIYLGEGADQFIGGKSEERVIDEDGADSYAMGDNHDRIWVEDDGDADIFDGGAGNDRLILEDLEDGVTVNLGAQTLVINGTTDTVKNFERIIATHNADVLIGSNAGERFIGNGGGDTFTGGGGQDKLEGGDGADTFIFSAITDSGKTKTTRDIIANFDSDEDHIKITFDADTTGGGAGDDFSVLLENAAFTGDAGELRYIYRGGQTVVEGDVNGDGKADFSIAINGHHNLDLSDFMFS